jgi:predicted Zn-dependent peptidase
MFRKELLLDRIPLVMERITGVRSISLGIWVRVGSRYEKREQSGISHFLEHMFFKGTGKRTQKEIAYEIDSLGGDLNAFTSKETTTFYIKVLDEHLEKGIELLMDIFLNSLFPEEEIRREKDVVMEELRMAEDTPDEYGHDLFSEHVWGPGGLGLRILGSRETVRSFTRDDLFQHINSYYGADNIVISCAGNIELEKITGIIGDYAGAIPIPENNLSSVAGGQEFRDGVRVVTRDHSEVHLCMGVEGIPQGSPDRYTMLLLNTIIGSGVSSRLFQEIREMRGLAYSVYSFVSSYIDSGLFGVYVGTGRNNYQMVIDLVRKELAGFKDTVTGDELARAKEQLKGNLILALESTSGRMNSIARQEIYYGRYYSPAEIIEEIERVQIHQLRALADRLFSGERLALTVLGPVKEAVL